MAKYYGLIGFAESVETEPGIWEDVITPRAYFGDTMKNTRMLQSSGGVNDNINISNQISIVADPYANENIDTIRYAEFRGTKWKVTNVEVTETPRLLLTLGGVWNG